MSFLHLSDTEFRVEYFIIQYRAKNVALNVVNEKNCVVRLFISAPFNIFDNYRFRDLILADLCLYKYCMLIRTVALKMKKSIDVSFDLNHFVRFRFVQRITFKLFEMFTVVFSKFFFANETAECMIRNDHSNTETIENDLIELQLKLFVL